MMERLGRCKKKQAGECTSSSCLSQALCEPVCLICRRAGRAATGRTPTIRTKKLRDD